MLTTNIVTNVHDEYIVIRLPRTSLGELHTFLLITVRHSLSLSLSTYIFIYLFIYLYILTRDKNKDTPKVCSEAFRPILFDELHGEEQNTAKTTWHIYTQAKPDKSTCTC